MIVLAIVTVTLVLGGVAYTIWLTTRREREQERFDTEFDRIVRHHQVHENFYGSDWPEDP